MADGRYCGWVAAYIASARLPCPWCQPTLRHRAFAGASWQRCRAHFGRNLQAQAPKASRPEVGALLQSVDDQPDADAVHAQFDRVVASLADKLPQAVDHLDAARDDILSFTTFRKQVWRQVWSNNPGSG